MIYYKYLITLRAHVDKMAPRFRFFIELLLRLSNSDVAVIEVDSLNPSFNYNPSPEITQHSASINDRLPDHIQAVNDKEKLCGNEVNSKDKQRKNAMQTFKFRLIYGFVCILFVVYILPLRMVVIASGFMIFKICNNWVPDLIKTEHEYSMALKDHMDAITDRQDMYDLIAKFTDYRMNL